jgi:diguanylate cyclase (GGDEF)-like protein
VARRRWRATSYDSPPQSAGGRVEFSGPVIAYAGGGSNGVQNELLALLVALLGAAVVFSAWAWIGRRRLMTERAELDRSLEERTADIESLRLQLQRLSLEDPLTAVANHEHLFGFLEKEWRRARREGLPVSLIFVDLDEFRAFNRQYGRQAGDECLKQVSRVLGRVVGRPGDLVARYQRDEFGIVLAATDTDGARGVAERVRLGIEGLQIPAAPEAPAPVVTASVAVTTAVPARESIWEDLDLIKAARYAMREAQAGGGNRVRRAGLGPTGQPELLER